MSEYKWISVWDIENTMVDDENEIQSSIEGFIACAMNEDFEFKIWNAIGLSSISIGTEMHTLFRGQIA